MKVAIIIITYNIPSEVTILQINAIRKFCKDEHEIFIVDNSTDKDLGEGTRYHSVQLAVQYMKTNASSKNGSDSHAFAANFSYQRFKEFGGILAYLDHDVIPVKEWSYSDLLVGKFCGGLGQGGDSPYFWPGMFFFDNYLIERSLVDFSPCAGKDTGGALYKLIEKYGKEQCVFLNESYHENPYYKSPKYGHYSMINNESFIHFLGGSNWINISDNNERINSLINVTKELIGD